MSCATALATLACGGEFTSDGGAGGTGGMGGSAAGGSGGSAAAGSGAGGSGGSAAGGSGGSAAGGSGAGGSGGTSNPRWECEVNADCGEGVCVQLTPGGFRACAQPVEHATDCIGQEPGCCSDGDCSDGAACIAEPLLPFCGGAFPQERSVCARDECSSTADCKGAAICLPAGVFGAKIATCRELDCTKDSDCNAHAGGQCAAVADPCCGVRTLSCVYPGGCFSQKDCSDSEYCQPMPGGASCLPGGAPCPA